MDNSHCYNSMASLEIATNFSICHDSKVMAACAKIYSDHLITIEMSANLAFALNWNWDGKSSVKWTLRQWTCLLMKHITSSIFIIARHIQAIYMHPVRIPSVTMCMYGHFMKDFNTSRKHNDDCTFSFLFVIFLRFLLRSANIASWNASSLWRSLTARPPL